MVFLQFDGSILVPFRSQNQPWGRPGPKRQIFKNLCSTKVKHYFLRSDGAPGLPKSLPEPSLKLIAFLYRFIHPKCTKNEFRMRSKVNLEAV